MTHCAYVNERLDDYLDGTLDRDQRQRVEAHLASCPRCAGEARVLREVVAAARRLPRSVPPPPAVWAGIDLALDRHAVRGRIRRVVSIRPLILAVAAAILVLLTASVTAVVVRRSAGPPAPLAVQAGDPTSAVEAEFRTAVRELEDVLAERRGELSPGALAVVEQSLRVIDAAILEARAAFAEDHDNPALAAVLWNSYRNKVDLLARVTRL